MGNHAKEILLVDRSNKIVQGQVLDLTEASEGTDIVVRAGTFKEAGQSTLVIVTADTPINPKEDRDEWLIRSRTLSTSIASSMEPVHPGILILLASNPVDLYVQSFQHCFSDVLPSRIFGIGTTMATARFASWLSQMSNFKEPVVEDAYCIGSQLYPVILWNHAKVNNTMASNIPSLVSHRSLLETIVSSHRQKLTIERKGQAWYGLASTVTRISAELLLSASTSNSSNRKGKGKAPTINMDPPQRVWVLSTYVPQYDTCLSWPVQLSNEGIVKMMEIPLTSDEYVQVVAVVKSNTLDFYRSSLDNP